MKIVKSNRLIYVFAVYQFSLFLSCDTRNNGVDNNPSFVLSDSVISICLYKDIVVKWNSKTYEIIEDTLYQTIKLNFDHTKRILAEQIADKRKTLVKECFSSKSYLSVGDISFLVIDKIEKIPYLHVFNIQWDVYDLDCKYPSGMFYYFENDRNVARDKVKSFLKIN